MAAKETLSGTVFCSGCMLTFIFLSMIALGVYTAGPTSNRDISRHTPFYFIKETGCDRRQLPWFGTNYNMTLDDKGWQVMPGWALCPVLGVYNSCPGCLPDPNGGDAPTFSYTNCIYFNNDKFWTSLDVIAQGAKNNNTSTTTFGPDAAFLNGPVQSMTLAALLLYVLYPPIIFGASFYPDKNAYRVMLVSITACLVLVTIATALWIASYIHITQTVFSSPTAYTRTLFRSCTVVVTPDMGAKIHLSCCVLSALSWGILMLDLGAIWTAYKEDQVNPTIAPALTPMGPNGGVINDGRSGEEEEWQPVALADQAPVVMQ